jgi:hypothetical protein
MSAEVRTVLGAAHQRYRTDVALVAWALLYLPWTVLWWPAGLLAVAGTIVGYQRACASGRVLATLIEATVDLHQKVLADAVGVDLPEGRITPREGNRINAILIKGA